MFAVIGGLLGFAGVIIWWLFFSRAAWLDRVAAIVVMFAALAATYPFLDVSLATGSGISARRRADRSRGCQRDRGAG